MNASDLLDTVLVFKRWLPRTQRLEHGVTGALLSTPHPGLKSKLLPQPKWTFLLVDYSQVPFIPTYRSLSKSVT